MSVAVGRRTETTALPSPPWARDKSLASGKPAASSTRSGESPADEDIAMPIPEGRQERGGYSQRN